MAGVIDAVTLRAWLNDGMEIALVDVRDGGPYARGHILVATGLPRSNFETHVPRLLPRRSVRIVLTDDDGTSLTEAADLLERHGYTSVHVLADGNAGWVAAGWQLFAGSNIVSKVFGEIVEERCGTPHVGPDTLRDWTSEGRPFHLFDVRPAAEFRTVSIPGAANCPGMETVVRIPPQVTDGAVPVVVNCAGRTRSIIGAQTLREAGITNPVFALENGTMGWQLHGFEPDHDKSNLVPEPAVQDLEAARRAAGEFAARNSIRFIDHATLTSWLGDDDRTTYLFDVRLAEAHALGRVPGSVNAPGGQLVQNTDTYAAVRHARIVVADELGVQSVMTAHWLTRMGWDAWVLSDAFDHFSDATPDGNTLLREPDSRVESMDVADLARLVAADACTVIDVGESYWYRQGRIAGSCYAMRSRLGEALASFPRDRLLVFTCATGSSAPFAAGDALALGFARVGHLKGGRAAWRRAGGAVEVIDMVDDDRVLTETDDMWYPPWARAEGAREAMAEYLSWEVGLVERCRKEEYLRFSPAFDLH